MRTKTIAATALAVVLGLGAAVASPAEADAPRGAASKTASAGGPSSTERVWFVGRGNCVWGVIPILGHQVIVMEPCEDGDVNSY